MERPVRQAYLGMISKQVAPVLRGHGFKRSRGTFRQISDAGHAAVIEFQGSRAGGGDVSLFYVNLGVATASWLDWRQERFGGDHRGRPTASDGQWWTRLGAASRHYAEPFGCWVIGSVVDAPDCGVALGRELTERVMPTFDAWLAHYVQLDEALADGRESDLPVLLAAQPAGSVDGIQNFSRPSHPYVEWMGSRR
ncbi:DUF4304 domain-containing protein [Micromonospora purpureochromogenes]|uniref:DUF4304 domain-containing protein n=1 Tax=Micromonospora purpureochromogenes TaxID=47872 RepID=UPI0033344E40